jgi:preprotein translocase subunit SecE
VEILAKGFFKDMRSELKKVVWPTKKQIVNNTLWVMILVIVVAVVVLGVDLVLEKIDATLWNKIDSSNDVGIYSENNNVDIYDEDTLDVVTK